MNPVPVVPVKNTNSVTVRLVKVSLIKRVVAGIVCDDKKNFLIAERQAFQKHPFCWEFPGGKVESGETDYQALCRELQEEVGLQVRAAREFRRIDHDYQAYFVKLVVYWVTDFVGEAYGAEGQQVRWVPGCELSQYTFPKANNTLIEVLSTGEDLHIDWE